MWEVGTLTFSGGKVQTGPSMLKEGGGGCGKKKHQQRLAHRLVSGF